MESGSRPGSGNSSGINPEEEKILQVTVLRSKSLKRVIYVECEKAFVDVLLSILIMPIGAVLKLFDDEGLTDDLKLGVVNFYGSVTGIETSAMMVDKKKLTNPATPRHTLRICASEGWKCINGKCANATEFERQLCRKCKIITWLKCSVSDNYDHRSCFQCFFLQSYPSRHTQCPSCRTVMREYSIIEPPGPTPMASSDVNAQSPGEGVPREEMTSGFVKENITFMIRDDLSIIKSSTTAVISMLTTLKIENFQDLNSCEIKVGRKEGLLLVKAALVSATPLTDAFEALCK